MELWDLSAPVTSRTLAVRQTPKGAVTAFSPDGRTMAVFRNDTREIQLLGISDPRNPDVLATFRPRAYVDGTVQVAGPLPVYSADSRLLAVLDGDRTVRLWDIGNPRKPAVVTTFKVGHQVGALSMSADGRQLFARHRGQRRATPVPRRRGRGEADLRDRVPEDHRGRVAGALPGPAVPAAVPLTAVWEVRGVVVHFGLERGWRELWWRRLSPRLARFGWRL